MSSGQGERNCQAELDRIPDHFSPHSIKRFRDLQEKASSVQLTFCSFEAQVRKRFMTPELREERRDPARADTITFDKPPQARLGYQENFDTL